MFFAALIPSLALAWGAPWWSLPLAAFAAGLTLPFTNWKSLQTALASGVAVAALAWLRDGQSHGLIATRLAAMFQLPGAGSLFCVVALFNFVTVALSLQSGRSFRDWRLSR